MSVHQITPDGIESLFEAEEGDRTGLEPGDSLDSYPDAPARGEEAEERAAGLEDDDRVIVLSDAVPAAQIDPSTPYVIQDEYGRALCVNKAGGGSWQWAYVGDYDSYPNDVFPLFFSQDPTQGSELTAKTSQDWTLHSNGTATSWEWTFWAKSNYSASYPSMKLKATLAQTAPGQPDKYELSWSNQGKTMRLCADAGAWNWLYVSSTHTAAQFTFHKFYVQKSKTLKLFQKTWPKASFVYSAFNTADEYYEAITDQQAKTVWTHSGLSPNMYRPDVFDCDDFSYVYKAQASKDAYVQKPEYGYAVGVIFASAPTGAHAVNVFIDTAGTVRIIEPQNGSIVAGADWKDGDGNAYKPFFVLM